MDDTNKLIVATFAMQGMLAHATRYKPRAQDQGLHWHKAIAKEAFDIAEAMGKEAEARIVEL